MSESTPLLSKSSTDSDSVKQPSILANYIAGLSSGHLPSNPQLYLLLHKAAGFLEGISQAKVSLPTTQNHQNQSQNEDPNLATDFLQESSQLCRDLSRWLSVSSSSDKNNNKDVQEQLQDHQQQEDDDDSLSEESDDEQDKELNQKIKKTRKDQKEEELKELPRGNQNEQIQRFIWNLVRSFQEYQFNINLNLNLKTDGIKMEEVKEDIKEGAEKVKEGAQTVTSDVKKGGGAIESLVEVFAAALVPEIQQLVLDLTLLFRENLADKASTIHEKAKGVEEQVRPDEQEQESDSPIKDLAQATKDAAGVVLGRDGQDQEASAENGKEGKGKGKEQDRSELDEKDSLWISEASERIGRVLEKAQASPSYSPAVQTLFSLSHRYASFFTSFINYLSESVPDKVVSGKDQVISAATEAIDGAEPEVPLDLGGAEDYFREACKAFEEVLIGLAGGQSLDPIKKSMRSVVEDLKGDGAWSDWWNDFKEFLNKTATKVKPEDDDEEDQKEKEQKSDANGEASSETKKDASSTSNDDSSNFKVQSSPPSETKVELQNLLTRLQVLMNSKPQYREHLNELTSKIQDFRELMEIEPLGAKIRHRIRKIFASLKDSLDGGWESLKTHGKSTLKDLFFAILPSVMDVIKVLPMPRIEFLSDDLEATVDDLTIPVVQLIPDKIKVSTQLDAEYDRTSNFSSTNVDSSINVAIEGLKLELRDISFYLCEHFTAPKPTSLFGCCSCQCISSCNHCGGGPSNWLSYTERAFLDVGFGGEGVGLEIDLVDSGQNPKYKDEEEERTTFFDVRKVKVDMKESFDFKLRNSRHWLINASLRPILRPVVRLVLQRVISEQVEHGYNSLDKWSYDIYSRAKYLANDGYENVGIGNDEKSKKKSEIKEPGMLDYLAVLINSEKGKSKARIRKEKKEKEIKEKEEKKEKEKKDEELEEIRSHQPEGMKEMRIKPSGIIKTDPSGSYSVSIGLSDPLLPGPEHSGPRTNRTELRSDVIHGNWKRLGKRSTKGIRDAASEADVLGIARNVGQSVGDSVKRVGEIKELVKEERQEEREEIRKDRDQGKDDWRSDIFDL